MAEVSYKSFGSGTLGVPYSALAVARVDGAELELPLQFERVHQSTHTPEDLAEAILDRRAVDEACGVAMAIAAERGARSEDALYIIGTPDALVCKIGVASNPKVRLATLQSARPDRIVIHGLLWSMENKAVALEQLCLRIARKIGARLSGEWVDLPPLACATLIATTALELASPFADSAMWLRNRKALSDARKVVTTARNDNFAHANPHVTARYGEDLMHSSGTRSQNDQRVKFRGR